MKIIFTLVVLAALTVGFVGYTTPGHRVLNSMGFSTAECGGSNC